jgi:predicted PurR-regulated permease PerM
MATLEAASELVGLADDESKHPALAAPEQVATDTDDVPVPPDIRTVFQGGIFLLMLLGACYAAAEIVLPIVLAFVLMLVLQPAMRFLERWHLPRGLAALALIVMLFGALIGLGTALSGPAADWAQKLPEGIPKLQERLSLDHGKDSDEILTHRPAWLTGESLSPNRVCTKPC